MALMLPKVSHAQELECNSRLEGVVIDKDNGQPLRYAAVFIKSLNLGTYTNDSGKFELRSLCDGKYLVNCHHIDCGDTTIEVIVKGNTSVRFLLPHTSFALDEVLISAEHSEERTTIPQEKLEGIALEQVKGVSLGKALSEISGVSTLQTGPTIFKPVIHGLYGNRILIVNQHVRLESQQWGTEHAPEVDPYASEEIRVIKGAGMLRYGPDALGGVVIMEPGPIHPEHGVEGMVRTSFFSNNGQGNISAMIEGRPKKLHSLGWRLQGTISAAGNSKTPGYYLKNTGFREGNISGLLQYYRAKAGIDISYSRYNTRLGIFSGSHIGNLTDLYRAFESPEPLEKAGFSYDIEEPYQLVSHDLIKTEGYVRTGNAGKLNAILAYQNNNRREFDEHGSSEGPALQLELGSYSGDIFWEQSRRKYFKTIAGISGTYQANIFSGRFFIPNYENTGAGAYIIENWRKGRWEAEAGARYDYRLLQVYLNEGGEIRSPQHTFQGPSFNTGITYHVESITLGLQAGSAWRTPSVNELYSNGLHHGAATIEIGDTTLGTERAYNISTSMKYSGKKLEADLVLYVNYIQDYIYQAPQLPAQLTIRGAFPVVKYQHTDALFKGADAGVKYNFTHNLTTGIKGSFLQADNLLTDEGLVLVPTSRATASLTYKTEKIKWFSKAFFTLSGQYVFRQNHLPPNSDYVPAPDAYYLLNFESGYIWKTNREHEAYLGIGVQNILNSRYRDYLDRFRYFADATGRNIMVRLALPLDFTKDIKY